jgi:hypothetical protein
MKDRSLLAVLVLMWVATAAALTVSILAYQEARSLRAMFGTPTTITPEQMQECIRTGCSRAVPLAGNAR